MDYAPTPTETHTNTQIFSCSTNLKLGPPGSSVHGISRQEYWSGLPFPPPEDLPHPGIKPMSLTSPALAGGFFTTVPPGKPHEIWGKATNLNPSSLQ